MELRIIHDITLDIEETIVAATLTDADNWVMLLSSGWVCRYSPVSNVLDQLFRADRDEFDMKAVISIYTVDSIIVVVNDHKTDGYLHTKRYQRVRLCREDHHAKFSQFPIALFRDNAGVPHLIHAVA